MKLICFDLDGVLVDTKGIHFDALNDALIAHGHDPITKEEHLSRYDGLTFWAFLMMIRKRLVSLNRQ